uniref:Uncharacterized protein n=1 Tax=Anguilla anguilla TaxID=7936 RepID=A0A0E9X7V9_ANGAN
MQCPNAVPLLVSPHPMLSAWLIYGCFITTHTLCRSESDHQHIYIQDCGCKNEAKISIHHCVSSEEINKIYTERVNWQIHGGLIHLQVVYTLSTRSN